MNLLEYIQRRFEPNKFWKKKGMKIGSNVKIYPSAYFGTEPFLIEIGNNVRINSNVEFFTHDGGTWVVKNVLGINDRTSTIGLYNSIKIGNNVHIGSRAIIMPGVTIGNNCIVGVGAIVTKDLPDNSIAAGIPARVIESIDDYISKHKDDFDYTVFASSEDKKKYLINKFKSVKNSSK